MMATSSRARYRVRSGRIRDRRSADCSSADFRRLWGAQAVVAFGSEITALAFLDGGPCSGCFSGTDGTACCRWYGAIPALQSRGGVWVDRRQRRPVLIATDIVRAGLLLSIPLTAWLGVLRIELLYAVTFLVGVLGVFFEVAHYAYVPSLVGRESVVEANSKLQISYSAAEAGGPGVAGLLVQFISAPGAMAIDALSFLVSAVLLRQIETPEPPVDTQPRAACTTTSRSVCGIARASLVAPDRPGLHHRQSLPQGNCGHLYLYATRELEISPVTLGIILAVGGIGAIPGALLRARGPSFWCWPDHHRRLADRYGNVAADSAGDRTARRAGAGGEHAAGRNRGNDRQRAAVELAPVGDARRVTGTSHRQPSLPRLRRLPHRSVAWRLARRKARSATGDRALRVGGAHCAVMGRLFTATAPAAATAASE